MNVPALDVASGKGAKTSYGDPYLILTAFDSTGVAVDTVSTSYGMNVLHHQWDETFRLFCIEDQAESSRTPPLTLQIALMDKNMKKEDVYIGAVTTRLQVGLGKTRVEIKSELP